MVSTKRRIQWYHFGGFSTIIGWVNSAVSDKIEKEIFEYAQEKNGELRK